jgi:hypothetical protein
MVNQTNCSNTVLTDIHYAKLSATSLTYIAGKNIWFNIYDMFIIEISK